MYVATKFVQENGHGVLPIVSEIWLNNLIRFIVTDDEYNRLKALKNRISEASIYFLNHSEMLSEWKLDNGWYGETEHFEK